MTQFSVLVLFSVSTGSSRHLHLEYSESSSHFHSSNLDHLSIWIIITGFGSSLDLDHHGTSSLDLDYLLIWINITGSGSSLNLDNHHWTGSGSSLNLDHHCWIWIITRSGSSSLDWIWIITRSESLGVIITGSRS